MSYSYRCGRCGITSPPYLLRMLAERHGVGHRGDHPDGECIVEAGFRRLERGEMRAVVIALALIAVALLGKLF
ncbi:hypothetical protein ACFV3E_44500 [Streptomyces sp. NPDC059718]